MEKNADQKKIKNAYRKLALEFHPDRNAGNKEAEEKFKEISAAYEVLNDPDKRSKYDQYGDLNPAFENYSDPINDFFKHAGFDFFGGRPRRTKGGDIRKNLHLTFMEAVKGCSKNVKVSYSVTCNSCNGNGAKDENSIKTCITCAGRGKVGHRQGFMQILSTCGSCSGQGYQITEKCTSCRGSGAINKDETIKVNIPAGVDETTTMRLSGKGCLSDLGGENGDLYLILKIGSHHKFKRFGANIQSEEELSYLDAILGTTIKVDTVQGVFDLKIPQGTQPNSMLKLNNKGIEKGDHIVNIKVKIPKNISIEERTILEQIRNKDK